MSAREAPIRVRLVDGAAAVEGVTAALEREGGAEAARVDPDGTAPADAAVEEHDCPVVGAGAPDAWTDEQSAVPVCGSARTGPTSVRARGRVTRPRSG